MPVEVSVGRIANVLTRASGYLESVCSHSLQPYRGCTYGNSLCGVGCYVQHNRHLTRGARWGSFLEARIDAAESYRSHYARERRWGRSARGGFRIFLSSSTDPFLPQERRFGITRRVLEAMLELPPDGLILQTHSHRVTDCLDVCTRLARTTDLRVHLSIESDRDRLPGLPPPASSVERRFEAAERLRSAGLRVVVTVSPLLPIAEPRRFFQRIGVVADAVVLDHFVGGDGTPEGARTLRTRLPAAMAAVDPESVDVSYRDRMVALAVEILPGRVGVGPDGFAGRMLSVESAARLEQNPDTSS